MLRIAHLRTGHRLIYKPNGRYLLLHREEWDIIASSDSPMNQQDWSKYLTKDDLISDQREVDDTITGKRVGQQLNHELKKTSPRLYEYVQSLDFF